MFFLTQDTIVSKLLRRSSLFLPAAALLVAMIPAPASAAKPSFKLHYVDKDNGWATAAMQTTLADIDHDGDLDWAVGNGFGKDTGFWWYEYQGPATWVKHMLSTGDTRVGFAGVALDVNGDGLLDLISGGMLFINKGNREFSKGVRHWHHNYVDPGES